MTMNTTQTNAANPNHLLDLISEKLGVKNDAQLARAMGVSPPTISKTRHHVIEFGHAMLIRAHDLTGMSLNDMRSHLNQLPFTRADRAAV